MSIRGERQVELSEDFHKQLSNRLSYVSQAFQSSNSSGNLGIPSTVFKNTLPTSTNTQLLNELTAASQKAKALLTQQPNSVAPNTVTVQPRTIPSSSTPAPAVQTQAKALQPKMPPNASLEVSKLPAKTIRQTIAENRTSLLKLASDLAAGHYEKSLLLTQLVAKLERQTLEAFSIELEALAKSRPSVSQQISALNTKLPGVLQEQDDNKTLSRQEVLSKLSTWLASFEALVSSYNLLVAQLARLENSKQTSALQPKKPGSVYASEIRPNQTPKQKPLPEPFTTLSVLAAGLIETTRPVVPKPTYSPIALAEPVPTTADLITKEVAAQLEVEKSKLEEQIRQELEVGKEKLAAEHARESAPSEEKPEAITVVVRPASPGETAATSLPQTEIAQPGTAPELLQPKHGAKVTVDETILKRIAAQEEVQKMISQSQGLINNLPLDTLSGGARENILSRLQSIENQTEIMRQYDDLRYQKEKERLSAEIKTLMEEANQKTQAPEQAIVEGKAAEETRKQTELERKAQIAAEVKTLVEKEKARKAHSHNIVQAQPAYGKMIPPKVSFPNVVNGLVRDNKGLLLAGVVMIIKDTNGEPVRAFKSNKIGQFVISTPLPNGTYNIELEKEGYDFNIVQVEVKGEVMSPIEIRSL